MARRKISKRAVNFLSREISRQFRKGKPLNQSIAIGFSKTRRKFPRQKKLLERDRKPIIKRIIRVG